MAAVGAADDGEPDDAADGGVESVPEGTGAGVTERNDEGRADGAVEDVAEGPDVESADGFVVTVDEAVEGTLPGAGDGV